MQNQEISGELNSLKDRLSHAEYLLHLRQKRLYFMNASRLVTPCGNGSQPEEVLSREGQLEIPTVFQHLPHLLGKAGALVPRVSIGKNRDKGLKYSCCVCVKDYCAVLCISIKNRYITDMCVVINPHRPFVCKFCA